MSRWFAEYRRLQREERERRERHHHRRHHEHVTLRLVVAVTVRQG